MLLCRFSGAAQELTGSALLTSPAAVSPVAAALNSVIATNGAPCAGTGRVIILLGDSHDVAALDVGAGGCPYLNSPDTVATYRHTPLLDHFTGQLTTSECKRGGHQAPNTTRGLASPQCPALLTG